MDVGRELARDYELKAVVHNGAVQPIGGAGETPWDEWANALRVNVIAVDALTSGARENLAANDGSVVVISSVHGRATTGGITAYATTKAALEGWVRSAAMDLAPEIRVNAVCSGSDRHREASRGFRALGGVGRGAQGDPAPAHCTAPHRGAERSRRGGVIPDR